MALSRAMLWRHLGAPTVLNQMRFVRNLVLAKFFLMSKKVCSRFIRKASVLVLLQKKDLPRNVHNLRTKMFYENRGHTFVLHYLIFE